jgi:hypothetical protein
MRYWTAEMERADALLFGRVTYEMTESAWRQPATGTWPDRMDEWEIPFADAKLGSERVGNWHGTTTGQVVLGSQKVTVEWPRGR